MQTPRPDRFTYPPHGSTDQDGQPGAATGEKPWLRAVFISGLVGFVALGVLLSL